MSCYTKHLGDFLDMLDMENTKENRKFLDVIIREIINKKGEKCPEVWKEVKSIRKDPHKMVDLIRKIKMHK